MAQIRTHEPAQATQLDVEFDRQLTALTDAQFHRAAGLPEPDFIALFDSVRTTLQSTLPRTTSPHKAASAPFALVVSPALADAQDLVPLLRYGARSNQGIVDPNHGPQGLAPYQPIADLTIPTSDVYAVVDVQRGEEFCDVAPKDAVAQILTRDRTPLTIHEGISLVATHPQLLEKNKCFMLAGSRRGDKRVPALWISQNAPKLGWCWEGNPHSWLGTASTSHRVA